MERIDVSKLLKDCPSGMKLDSTMYENIVFDKIIEDDEKFPIRVIRSDGLRINLTKYGQYADIGSAKCIIFPEGKTTWKGFHRPFKNGDVIYVCDEYSDATYTYVAILKQIENFGEISSHCFYNYEDNAFSVNDFLYDSCNMRFATEKEKEELFKAIKDNGYEWNPESKTLEKLMESKEDTNDKIVMSGIYFDRENYADEVELHLGNYEIEVRDGKTYAVYKNQETKISKPIFKIGDKIKHKDTVLTIVNVLTNSYVVEDEPDNFGLLMFSQQDKWELINEPKFKFKFKVDDKVKLKGGDEFGIITQVSDCFYTIKCKNNTHCWPIQKQDDWELINEPKFKVGDTIKNKGLDIVNPIEITGVTPKMYTFRDGSFQYVEIIDKNYVLISRKFDISSLKPYDKVLVRDTKEQVWVADLFSHVVNRPLGGYTFACVGHYPSQCIPYEGNEHLLGTTDDCDEYFNLIS
jgi:hypothetical protein